MIWCWNGQRTSSQYKLIRNHEIWISLNQLYFNDSIITWRESTTQSETIALMYLSLLDHLIGIMVWYMVYNYNGYVSEEDIYTEEMLVSCIVVVYCCLYPKFLCRSYFLTFALGLPLLLVRSWHQLKGHQCQVGYHCQPFYNFLQYLDSIYLHLQNFKGVRWCQDVLKCYSIHFLVKYKTSV